MIKRMPMVNGEGQMPPRAQRGMHRVETPRVSTEALRKLDHADWLENFARVMQLQTGIEMTPMRQGVIGRLNLAAEYIRLLQVDVKKLRKQAEACGDELDAEGR
jgi:hypothetical protein